MKFTPVVAILLDAIPTILNLQFVVCLLSEDT